ncbi:type II toxin-antitoxin system Phd/YefM family antitoxin [Actinomyces procaprae]|uniref:type II toxin-antitoxin system Phd/YefM family antitoxin n=1 Tax=Actinomyces procaprae TaxID=2560010 RepID=UPI00109DEEC4|nr:type II toxin-antitoxin system Phd/YefM family antitoxin [Actinomyces procaprae]
MNAQPAPGPHDARAQHSGSAVGAITRTVSLRELNQRSGRIVADVVASGRPVTITDRGRPVVRLVPIEAEETPYERLLREGLIQEAACERTGPLPSVNVPNGAQLYADFMAEREEER